ncbi:MAG: type II toxin-antitoxin system VapC family toxin [Thaumarchaeota archaeon]|nr:type II toxin-antitoxin system VapC family toxin [Nitrososphaerota archaeon]MCL5316781.1 type II toxin-antitoxin system VapC family toxin [Nitrososphaerota archaeon]
MVTKCYLDTNIFLNVIYNEHDFAQGSEHLLRSIQEGKLAGTTSSVTLTEIALDLAKMRNRDKIDQALGLIERMPNLTICPLGSWTAKLAVKLVLDSSITIHDAYHSATAIEHKADIFVTRDSYLAKKLKNAVKVSEPEVLISKLKLD